MRDISQFKTYLGNLNDTFGLCVWPFLLSQLYLRMVLFKVAGSLPYIVPANANQMLH